MVATAGLLGGLALPALVDDGGTELLMQGFRKLVEFRAAIDLDRPLGGVADHVAVVAPTQMLFQLLPGLLVDRVVEIIVEFV
jgi:hypothetical protein